MAKKQVKITSRGAGTLGLPLFRSFQGEGAEELKRLEKEDYERLKHELLEDGFSYPIAIWANSPDGENYILDGHQRVKALKKMQSEGYSVPELPVVMVDADSFDQAKRKLLAAASQYGTVQEAGLVAFLKTVSFSNEQLVGSFKLPEIDMLNFIETHLSNADSDPLDFSSSSIGEDSAPLSGADHTPKTSAEDKPLILGDTKSQVRMVQLFFNGETQPEFLQKIQKLQEVYEADNVTDCVLELVREAYNAIGKA